MRSNNCIVDASVETPEGILLQSPRDFYKDILHTHQIAIQFLIIALIINFSKSTRGEGHDKLAIIVGQLDISHAFRVG